MKTFFSSRSAARLTGHTVKDAGKDSPKGKRWYVEVIVPTGITDLLSKAKEATERYHAEYERRVKQGYSADSVFLCQIFYGTSGYSAKKEYQDWETIVGAFMDSQFKLARENTNNIASYIQDMFYNGDGTPESQILIHNVRAMWLSDLVEAALLHGDNAEFPPLMSKEEITKAYGDGVLTYLQALNKRLGNV